MKSKDLQDIQLDQIMLKIKQHIKNEYDIVIAIARGGILPGYLVARYLNIPLEIIYLRFRDDSHQKMYEHPEVIKEIDFSCAGLRVLLTDDVSNSGETFIKAKSLLIDASQITTCAISGNGDISLFGVHDRCIHWPWQN